MMPLPLSLMLRRKSVSMSLACRREESQTNTIVDTSNVKCTSGTGLKIFLQQKGLPLSSFSPSHLHFMSRGFERQKI